MKYKVGDKVRIKSLDWYNENKDEAGNIRYKKDGLAYPIFFSKYMSYFCGKTLTIKSVFKKSYHMNETSSCEFWTDEMIEGLAETGCECNDNCCETKDIMEEDIIDIDEFQNDNEIIDIIHEYVYRLEGNECQIARPEGYQFTDEDGNVINTTTIVLEKKKREYPKTYKECHEIMVQWKEYDCNPNSELILCDVPIHDFCKLIVARNIYWKIAGEEMGLGKPWEPDWKDGSIKYVILYDHNEIHADFFNCTANRILSFPTEEMRDAFYENFKDLIESVKELL